MRPLLFLLPLVACKEPPPKTRGIGDAMRPFIIQNASSGERYCQVCAYGGKPILMWVADLDDAAAERDLARIQALVTAHEKVGLSAFAVFGEIDGGAFAPAASDVEASARLEALGAKLGLTFPLVIVPSSYTERERKGYVPFVEAYEVRESRRILLSNASNTIAFADTLDDASADAQFTRLAEAIARM
jgi:hypothetical protein